MIKLQDIEDLISRSRIEEAISKLKEYCKKSGSDNHRKVVILSAQYYGIQKKERIGLGEFNTELNRILQPLMAKLGLHAVAILYTGGSIAPTPTVNL